MTTDPTSQSPETPATTTRQLTCLHVGCGPKNGTGLHPAFTGPDWVEVRLDIDPAVQPDLVGSITDLSVLGDATVDAVWSSHNLEHLEPHEVPLALGVVPVGMSKIVYLT